VRRRKNPHIGSSLESFLKEEGIMPSVPVTTYVGAKKKPKAAAKPASKPKPKKK
jgi:hypothetical protein